MKKILAILMTICLLTSALSISASAAEETLSDPAEGTLLRVTATKGEDTVLIGDYTNFEEGWNIAVKEGRTTRTKFTGYERVIVDFYTDWISADDGNFTDDKWQEGNRLGFNNDTIHIPDDAILTINLNGHTIKRVLPDSISDGEVMYIDEDADVIINNGTITGGKSTNGAGGIHIHDAHVTLNNVHIVGNLADNDDGGGIALYDDATLVMNGGSVSNNITHGNSFIVYGSGVYIHESSAFFTNVTFENNQGRERSTQGAAVYVDDGTLSMDNCKVIGNGLEEPASGDERRAAYSIISIVGGSNVTLQKTAFLQNGYPREVPVSYNTQKFTAVISSKASYLTMEKCTFADNKQVYLIESEATVLNVTESDFSGNQSFAFFGNCARGFNSAFTNCKFSYNEPMLKLDDTFCFNLSDAGLSFIDCEFGDATFNNKGAAQFVDTDVANGRSLRFGSIFGEGSLSMIVALLALIASGVSIFLTVYYNKKKTAPVVADKEEETENEE